MINLQDVIPMNYSEEIKNLLDEEAAAINRPSFISEDPVQFPRRFSRLQDIEIASFLSATIAWGNRKMICRDADRMFALLENEPYNFVMDRGYEDIDPDINIHRTFFGRHMRQYLNGLHNIYSRYESLDAFSQSIRAGEDEAPAWRLVEGMQRLFTDANGGIPCERCLPNDLKNTALKRINMALRWLVRDDGIVDMGVWKSIPKNKLYIPLDVHVGNTARKLDLLTRKSNDRKAVEELTATLRSMNPADPALYDYALFGIGIKGKEINGENKINLTK